MSRFQYTEAGEKKKKKNYVIEKTIIEVHDMHGMRAVTMNLVE